MWPADSYKPIILCTPNDNVSLTIAESIANFDGLSGNEVREAVESRPYVPELPNSETKASVISLQITLFPDKGFCIGISGHHAVLDGKSSTMFVKAWANMCKHLEKGTQLSPPSPEHAPFFNREVIKGFAELETEHLNRWLASSKEGPDANPRSLKIRQDLGPTQNLVRSTFQMTHEDIKMFREKVISQLSKVKETNVTSSTIHLSTFVLICSYTLVCLVKAREGDGNGRILFVFSADARKRLDPPVPANYFGNCVCGQHFVAEASEFLEENGLARTANRISGLVKRLEQGLFERTNDVRQELGFVEPGNRFSVAGSTRFEVYGSDFGWGKPKKVEITSIDRTGAIALAESRNGSGGVEIGLVFEEA